MTTAALMIRPIPNGCAVVLSTGQELARYHGPGARLRATRHIHTIYGSDVVQTFGARGTRGFPR